MVKDNAIEANEGANAEAVAWIALRNTASACGSGSRPTDLQPLRALPAGRKSAREAAKVIFDGLLAGSQSAPEQLAASWDRFDGAVTQLIVELGRIWSDPAAGRRVQYYLEQMILDADDLAAPRRLSLTLGLRVDVRSPTPTKIPAGVDQIYACLMRDGQLKARMQFGALGTVTGDHWIGLARNSVPSELLEHKSDADSHFGKLANLAAQAQELVRSSAEASEPAQEPRRARTADGQGNDRTAFWNRHFETADPWKYGSPYEQEKYERQLEILPAAPIGRALELACAEGHFTRQLAPRVGHLTATDISPIAIERARQRCIDQPNVAFGVLDFDADALPGEMDLIFCSEVLYYLDDLAELRRIAKKIVEALAPGGHFISAHAFVLRDDPQRTGFDWNTFGAKAISQTLAETEGLVLEHSIQTELYRIDRFRRLLPGEVPTEPRIDHVPLHAPIGLGVLRKVIWGGARAFRRDVARSEKRQSIPVLMYHGVADDGPAALARFRCTPALFGSQMAWLRAHGFHAISSEQLEQSITNRQPFTGRPVLITFDDGFQNFADHAWPILRANDLTAEVFLVTDLVGKTALWDAAIGPPTPLMDAATVRRLAGEGAFFGSHMTTHRAIDGLSTSDLAAELLRSRMFIERWTGRPATSFAAPFSVTDRRLGRLARECGYRIGFGGRHGPADLDGDPIDLPRIEIRGDRSLVDFVAIIEAALE